MNGIDPRSRSSDYSHALSISTTLLFGGAVMFGVLAGSSDSAFEARAAKALLTLTGVWLVVWFLHAFASTDVADTSEDCQAEQRASMFRFAYLFAAICFASLLLPFTAMLRTHETTPDAGPIRLLRACVQVPAAAASAPRAESAVEHCPEIETSGTVSYPWLVSIGGVVAQGCGNGGRDCSKPEEALSAAATAATATTASAPAVAASGTATALPPLYRVSGGFVVPFYVVVLSFVGGVVSLTRRVPEYQKRSACTFKGTRKEPRVTFLEAREFVVFQLMQLLSAPFIAMVAYYAIEPKSVPTAVALAFVSGFATESVLLLIRGVVNGLRPETTEMESTTSAKAHLHVQVDGSRDKANPVTVEVRRLPNGPLVLSQADDASGETVFEGLEPGTAWVVATQSVEATTTTTSMQKVQLVAGQTESVTLTFPSLPNKSTS